MVGDYSPLLNVIMDMEVDGGYSLFEGESASVREIKEYIY